jgi:hypothetical protein
VIRFAEVAMGSGDACRCVRCHGGLVEPTYRPLDEIVAEVSTACDGWQGRPGPNIRLVGAEPFGHPGLPSIVAAAVAAGCQRLGVDTDGIALRSPSNAGGALMAGVRHVRFGLLGGTAGLHDALAGAPGSLDATVEGIHSYVSLAATERVDVSLTAVVPVCRHNFRDLPAAAALAVECGADAIHLRVESDGDADLDAVVPWIVAACDTGVVNGVWVEVEGVPFCLMPGYDLHVADAIRTRAGSKPPTCSDCALDPYCAGAAPGTPADQLARLAPPPFAERLAPSVAVAHRGEVA